MSISTYARMLASGVAQLVADHRDEVVLPYSATSFSRVIVEDRHHAGPPVSASATLTKASP